ncbi:MAG: glycosyltransferase [Methanomassiliicoccales archaeon]|jgi:glycosyltransferase involved in cell wall biosynthesis
MRPKRHTIAYVNNSDLLGRRFNGYDFQDHLANNGYDVEFFCFEKKSESCNVHPMMPWKYAPKIKGAIERLETTFSIQSLIYPFPITLAIQSKFNNVDIAHFQMIHNSFFSLQFLPSFSKRRPSVWTLHDPWALTGHCIHPYSCTKWHSGCHGCPNLDSPKQIKIDTAAILWSIKKDVVQRSDLTIHVLSNWMKEMVDSSPIMKGKKVRIIPIGVDMERFRPDRNIRREFRKSLGIPDESFVIMLRTSTNPFKGLEIAKKLLSKMRPKRQIFILTIDTKNLIENNMENIRIIDQGFVDDSLLIPSYQASDMFLMPSTAESFGVMAVEAMACGCPVICVKDTAVEETIRGCKSYLSIDPQHLEIIAEQIDDLSENFSYLFEMSQKVRDFSVKEYDKKVHMRSLVDLYDSLLE